MILFEERGHQFLVFAHRVLVTMAEIKIDQATLDSVKGKVVVLAGTFLTVTRSPIPEQHNSHISQAAHKASAQRQSPNSSNQERMSSSATGMRNKAPNSPSP